MASNSSRLVALDVLRGLTIAGMITVNNPGSWSYVYAPLLHAPWNGLTPTDLVFPFFMFIMGVSMYFSYEKYDFRLTRTTFLKLLKRSVLLFLVGLAIGWFGWFCRTLVSLRLEDLTLWQKLSQAAFGNFGRLRILGVLQRLALVSFFGSLTLLICKPRRVPWVAAAILLVYWVLIAASGSMELSDTNLISRVDQAVLGANHMYKLQGVVFDPEGLLSTLPCIAHALLGVMVGGFIRRSKSHSESMEKIFIFGTVIMMAGFLLHYAFPINKSLWSTSYVLATCGLASLLLALFIWIIDIRGHIRWTTFFRAFGTNPLAIFVLSGILSILLSNVGVTLAGEWTSIHTFFYRDLYVPLLGNYGGSLCYALVLIALLWSVAHLLYKKNIIIKL